MISETTWHHQMDELMDWFLLIKHSPTLTLEYSPPLYDQNLFVILTRYMVINWAVDDHVATLGNFHTVLISTVRSINNPY